MRKYTYYNTTTGVIVTNKQLLSDDEADLNTLDGCAWISNLYSPNEYCVVDGSPVAIPDKPDYPCHFDPTYMQWVWDEAVSWRDLRFERDRRLASSDWTQVPDAPVDHAAWAAYRQALRDLPDNTEDPRNPVWPSKPE
jgi:hypothetical protein